MAALAAAEARLADVARRTLRPQEVDALRGLEGEAAAACFAVFDALVRVDGLAFRFTVRSRRTPHAARPDRYGIGGQRDLRCASIARSLLRPGKQERVHGR